jgi:hypothetical protein
MSPDTGPCKHRYSGSLSSGVANRRSPAKRQPAILTRHTSPRGEIGPHTSSSLTFKCHTRAEV